MRQLGRKSKIVCTLGPATSDPDSIRALIQEGMDVCRINFSHGKHESHKQTIEKVRKASRELGIPVAILGDLQGPKIRTGLVSDHAKTDGGLAIKPGQQLWFRGCDENSKLTGDGTAKFPLSVSYLRLATDLQVGERVLFDDGLIEMEVCGHTPERDAIALQVIHGRVLGENKGVNMPNSRLSMLGITEKDWTDITFAMENDVDILALSFVRGYREIRNLKTFLQQKGKSIHVIAKIEKLEAVRDIDNILSYSDGIMVARGDLAVEVGNEKVPLIQKDLIARARSMAKPVITATQMLMSMVENPTPSRAEASDIANAVIDGSDALMLSNETATGKFPLESVRVMSRIIREAESHSATAPRAPSHPNPDNLNQGLARAAVQLAADVDAKFLTCLTRSGRTAQYLAQFRPTAPIIAFAADSKVAAQLCLSWGVSVIAWEEMKFRDSVVFDDLMHELIRLKIIAPRQKAIMLAGIPTSLESGTTNTICLKTAETDTLNG